MELNKVYCGKMEDILVDFTEDAIDSIVTDPPYGLNFMGKKWDYDVPSVTQWKEAYRVLKPGGYMLVACGTRTQHRMVVNIEDAGFEIRDVITWHYGCLSDDTEILTSNGWVEYRNLSVKEVDILCYDINKNSYHYEHPKKWNEYTIQDTCYRVQSDYTDQIVSRNHRCLIEREGKLLFEFAENIAQEQQAYIPFLEGMPNMQSSISNTYKRASIKKYNVFKRLPHKNFSVQKETESDTLGFVSMRGLRRKFQGKKRQVRVLFQKVQRSKKRSGVEEICTLREGFMEPKVGAGFSKSDDWKNKSLMEGWNNLPEQEGLLQQSQNKICSMPEGVYNNEQEGRLCDGVQVSNGTTDRQAVNQGRVCSSYRSQSNEQSDNELNVIQEQRRSQEIRVGKGYKTTLATFTPFEYIGVIFCPTVSTGAFVARRNGKIFLTGNSGFPKSLDISKAIDKQAGAEREKIINPLVKKQTASINTNDYGDYNAVTHIEPNPVTDEAKQWEGWGTALKPATEFWTLCRKPISENTVAENVLKHGTGGINIDACRIGCEDGRPLREVHELRKDVEYSGNSLMGRKDGSLQSSKAMGETTKGRFPANLILDEFMAAELDKQSGILTSGNVSSEGFKGEYTGTIYGKFKHNQIPGGSLYGDSGGASRFFYVAKPSPEERNKGLRMSNAQFMDESWKEGSIGGSNPRNRGAEFKRNNFHPTVKPIELMRYLVKMITPKGGTCLDSFCGSGSTLIACKLEEINYIGIDKEQEYCEMAEARIKAWPLQKDLFNL